VNRVDSTGLAYSATKAVAYARKWWNGHNPAFPNNDNHGGDCANFGSQCVNAGGLQMTSHTSSGWYATKNGCSPNWENANRLYTYIKGHRGTQIASTTQRPKYWSAAKVGDFIFFDLDTNGSVDHTTLVTYQYKASEATGVTCHTSPHLDYPWTNFSGKAYLVRPSG